MLKFNYNVNVEGELYKPQITALLKKVTIL